MCSAERDAVSRLLARARTLPHHPLSAGARERIAAGLLDTAAMVDAGWLRRRKRRVLLTGGAVLFACVAGAAAHHALRSRARSHAAFTTATRAKVSPFGSVAFERTRPAPDEVVTLQDGTLDVDVGPLATNERFRVVTVDSEVEVRGTSFRVSASHAELTAVHVAHGRVEVRRRGENPIVLGYGEHWIRAPRPPEVRLGGAAVSSVEMRDKDSGTAPPAPGKRLASRPVQRLSASVQFDEGWRLLRAGHTAEAAVKFADIEEHADAAELVEDAMFWRAVALGRSGRAADARSVLDTFLARFPASSRRGEAAVMLGWNLLQEGDREAARRLFESAANDPVDRVRTGARAGLARARAD
jgi:hypothetical protein